MVTGARAEQKGDIVIKKISGEENISDALTKHVDVERMVKHLSDTGQCRLSGRHRLMPSVTSNQ